MFFSNASNKAGVSWCEKEEAALAGETGSAVEIRGVLGNMCIHKDNPLVLRQGVNQLGHELGQQNGIRLPAQLVQPGLILAQRFLPQPLPQRVHHVVGDAVIRSIQATIANDQSAQPRTRRYGRTWRTPDRPELPACSALLLVAGRRTY